VVLIGIQMSKSLTSRRAKQAAEISRSSRRRVNDFDHLALDGANSWDEFSILCAGPDAVLTAPPEVPLSDLEVAVYGRYSTDAQKEASIRRQETNCATYYRTLGVRKHTLFADEGESASASVQRAALQALLTQCDNGKFDAIVVEDFDRWSRDLFDSVKIAERLDLAGVELHCAAVRRPLSLDDVVQLALAAQHDKLRRRNLCMAGQDQLVLEKHGMPWGRGFGYKKGEIPGHPEKAPEQAKAVLRAFELGLTLSASRTARALGEEGYISPNGTLLWHASTVTAMWNCSTYAGLIRYRKNLCRRSRKTGKVKVSPRPAYEFVQAYNEDFQIVSKDLYMALQKAVHSRTSKRDTGKPRQKGTVLLFGRATCDCKDATEDQHFYPNANRYNCSLYHERHSCHAKWSCGFPIEFVDRAILSMVGAALMPRLEEAKFRQEFLADLEKKAVILDGRRQEINLKLKKAEMEADRLLDPEFGLGASSKRIQAKRQEAEEKVTLLQSDLASVPRLNHLAVKYDEQAVRLRDAFDVVGARLPFLPVTEDDHQLIRLLRSLVKAVRVLREGRLAGQMKIEVDLHWAALFLPLDQVDACGFPIETLSTEVVLKNYTLAHEGTRQHWESIIASGVYALSDAQWKLVEPHLLDTTKTDRGGKGRFTTRQVADAMIFKMRSGIGLNSTSKIFGARSAMYASMHRFIYSGGVETLVKVIGATDPKWLDGLNVASLSKNVRGTDVAKFSRVVVKPERTAAACWDNKTFHLTDTQWNRIARVVDPGIEAPRCRQKRSTSARRLLDGIFVKLRTGCAWKKMPPEYGGHELVLAAMAFAYLGSWDRLVPILRKEFPDVIAGLNTYKMDTFPRRSAGKAAAKAVRNGKQVSAGSDSLSADRSKTRSRQEVGEGGRREGAKARPQQKSA
jgi:DNA invertase Pin-like site-specific DNA recombinase/transposase